MAEDKKVEEGTEVVDEKVAVDSVDSVDADPIVAKLQEFGISEEVIDDLDQLGVNNIDDLSLVTEADLVGIGVKPIQARKLLASLTPSQDADIMGAIPGMMATYDVLPTVLDDSSWLESLKAGGVLKVDMASVMSAIKASLASEVGLYKVPEILVGAMNEYAEESEEPVGEDFFKLQKLITKRAYADIFAAIDGLDGNFVTEPRKKVFFSRVKSTLMPAIGSFYRQLEQWYKSYLEMANNPGAIVAAISGRGMPGMMQIPDMSGLRDYAEAVNDAINKTFAGTGVPVASALAYDAMQINKVLSNPQLPALVGAPNKEQMLKKLGLAISSTYPRLENNFARFVVSILQVKDQPDGEAGVQYFTQLYAYGSQIDWSLLGINSGITGLGGGQL